MFKTAPVALREFIKAMKDMPIDSDAERQYMLRTVFEMEVIIDLLDFKHRMSVISTNEGGIIMMKIADPEEWKAMKGMLENGCLTINVETKPIVEEVLHAPEFDNPKTSEATDQA